jgi:hypothetical protein
LIPFDASTCSIRETVSATLHGLGFETMALAVAGAAV